MPDRPEPRPGAQPTHLLRLWFYCWAQFLRLSVFLSSPEKLPWNPWLLVPTLASYLLVGQLILGEARPFRDILLQIGIEVGLLALISLVVLKLNNHLERFVQTLHALVGVNLIISIISYPLIQLLPDPTSSEQPERLAIQLSLLLLIWNLAVISLIFRRAFEVSTMLAAFLSFSYFLFYEWVLMEVFA